MRHAAIVLTLLGCTPTTSTTVSPPPHQLTLTLGDMSPGEPVTIEVAGAAPFATVELVRTALQGGEQFCPPRLGGLCFSSYSGAYGHQRVVRGVADAAGQVRWSAARLPPQIGERWYYQAASLRPDAALSNVVRAHYEPSCTTQRGGADSSSAESVGPGWIDGIGLCDRADEAWFEVEIPPRTTMNAWSLVESTSRDDVARTAWRNSSGTLIDQDVVTNSTLRHDKLSYRNQRNATVYAWLVVSADTLGGMPGLSTSVFLEEVPGAGCTDDAFEPNDHSTRSTPVTPGTWDATLCNNDLDSYTIDVAAGDVLTATFTSPTANDVLDARWTLDGVTMDEHRAIRGDQGRVVQFVAPHAGVAELSADRVTSYDGVPGMPYTVQLERGRPLPCPADGLGNNHTLAAAVTVTPGTPRPAVVCPGQFDWFAVPVNAGERVQFVADVDRLGRREDLAIVLVDPTGTPYPATTYYGYNLDLPVVSYVTDEPEASTAGVWYARVELTADHAVELGAPYTIEARVGPATPCVPDAAEPNPNPARATDAPLGTSAWTLCPGDTDVFAIELPPGETWDLDVRSQAGEGTVTRQLRTASGFEYDNIGPLRAAVDTTWFLHVDARTEAGIQDGVPYTISLTPR